jgi:hypothetical protein
MFQPELLNEENIYSSGWPGRKCRINIGENNAGSPHYPNERLVI